VVPGTGNVLKIQQVLHACSDHIDVEKEEDKGKDMFQAFATLGLATIGMGEEIGLSCALLCRLPCDLARR
jgi:26S proteasome regulatory subunit N1